MGRAKKTIEDYLALEEKLGCKLVPCEIPANVRISTLWECNHCKHRWPGSFDKVSRTSGCPKCAKMRGIDWKRKKVSDYLELGERVGYKWDSEEIPANTHTKTFWICLNNHRVDISYSGLSYGKGCRYCARNVRKEPEDYRALAQSRQWFWLGPRVSNARTNTYWLCSRDHIVSSSYDNTKRQGCRGCVGIEASERNRYGPEIYVQTARERGWEWLGPEVPNAQVLTRWQCENGHEWMAKLNNIRNGKGCPRCVQSKGERRIAEILTGWEIDFTYEKTFDACRDIRPLSFDFYFQLGQYFWLIEFQGHAHYQVIEGWGGQETLEQNQRHDAIKAEFAQKYNLILICIPHWEFNRIEEILKEEIESRTGQIYPSIKPTSYPNLIEVGLIQGKQLTLF